MIRSFLKTFSAIALAVALVIVTGASSASAEVGVNDKAPTFKTTTHDGKSFDLAERKGKWTVLYFYPKADTPGCTKQACAFRDSINKIRDLGAEVYGVSADSVSDQAAFHKKHHLNFTLLADENADVISAYGTKMPVMKMSKRQTLIVGPDLTIKHVFRDVDPVKDAAQVAEVLTKLQKPAGSKN